MYKKRSFRKTATVLLAIISLLILFNYFLFQRSMGEQPFPSLQEHFQAPNISGRNYLLKKRGGPILASKQKEEQIAIASMTKIMTAMCIIEMVDNLDQLVEVPVDIFPEIEEQGLATAGLIAGEVISYRDLLYAIMLPSGADAVLTAVRAVSGSEEVFVGMMNEKAASLGMSRTHFSNTTGKDAAEHYSTVEDVMLLLEHALQNEMIYQIFTTLSYQSAATNFHPEGLPFFSTLTSQNESLDVENGRILGGKTGYTVAAGLCLASVAEIDGEEYLLVLAGSKGDSLTEQFNIIESRILYDMV